MAISSDEQNQILGLMVGMFNAAAGEVFYTALEDYYVASNSNLSTLYSDVGHLELFTSQFSGLDQDATADKILMHFGLSTADNGAGDIIYSYIVGEIASGTQNSQIIQNIVSFLLTDGIDTVFENAVNNLNNKITVSEYYSLDQSLSSTDISTLQGVLSSVTDDETTATETISGISISQRCTIDSITIPDGNYSHGGDINITVNFTDSITVSGVNSTLSLQIGDEIVEASLYSYTSNSLSFKYNVEDGFISENQTVSVVENGITLNGGTIKDQDGTYANLMFATTVNESAIVTDALAPDYSLFNAHYDTDTNILNIYGLGFSSILESDEDHNTDIVEKIDFTKLIWDIDGDDETEYTSGYLFDASNILSVKVENDFTLAIAINDTQVLEADANYSSSGGNDTLDILQGFLVDSAGNVSQSMTTNDLVLGIDNILVGDDNPNSFVGTVNSDAILTLGSDDIIFSMEGNDTITSGAGNDLIYSGLGIDTISGGDGDDTFMFMHGDTYPLFTDNFGIDAITDLVLNGSSDDLIDLDITVQNTTAAVEGMVNQSTFIVDMNSLLAVETNGFDTSSSDITVSSVSVTSGDLSGTTYLAVDYNANNMFDENDMVINITGSNISSMDTGSFI